MIIKIKGKEYSPVNFQVQKGVLEVQVHSEATFAELIEDFVLEAGQSITQYNDNEEQIGAFYVEGMASIQLPGEGDLDVVIIKYHVSQIGKDAQEALANDLDDTSMSVLELAGLFSVSKKQFTDMVEEMRACRDDYINRFESINQRQNNVQDALSRLYDTVNDLADRVAVLENRNQ